MVSPQRNPSMSLEQDIYTVSRLNQAARLLLEGSFPLIWVEGEISNLSRPSSGHLYFSLKDAKAQTKGTIECMACADCVPICKEGAITLTRSYRYSGFCKTIGSGNLTPPRL